MLSRKVWSAEPPRRQAQRAARVEDANHRSRQLRRRSEPRRRQRERRRRRVRLDVLRTACGLPPRRNRVAGMAPSRTGRREHASYHLPEHPRVVTALCVLEDAQGGALKGMMPPQGHASAPRRCRRIDGDARPPPAVIIRHPPPVRRHRPMSRTSDGLPPVDLPPRPPDEGADERLTRRQLTRRHAAHVTAPTVQ